MTTDKLTYLRQLIVAKSFENIFAAGELLGGDSKAAKAGDRFRGIAQGLLQAIKLLDQVVAIESPPASTPHQSSRSNVRFPGTTLAARDLCIDRTHLHRVLTGERESASLLAAWDAWLSRNPQFRRLQKVS